MEVKAVMLAAIKTAVHMAIYSSYEIIISSSWAASKHMAATWKFIFHWDCHQITCVISFLHWDLHLIAICHWEFALGLSPIFLFI